MLNDLQRPPEPVAKLPPLLSAPRVSVRQTEGGQVIEPAPDTEPNGVGFREAFLNAFGSANEIVAQALYEQVLNALNTASGRPIDDATANLALALMHEIQPKDAVEATLACQMCVAHCAAMDAARRALHAEQTPGGRQAYMSISRRLMTLYAAQVDILNRHRGKGTTQKIVIERVVVAPGAQAVVGAISARGEGMADNSGGRPGEAGGVNPFAHLPRCGAKNRRGEPCRRVGNARNGRCHLHGGRSPGGPRGARNGNWKHGYYGLEAQAERSRLRKLIRQMRSTMDELP